MNYTVDIYKNLNSKYQSRFNFYFSKGVNEIVFNHTIATSTISFKDAVIFAETTEYLKRHYYMLDYEGNPEILDRVKMLAGFYCSAIILKYEYPSMIVTGTKDIFIRRLRRYKKILTDEGSSDESASEEIERTIELHVDTFLASVNSSELSKKTHQLREEEERARLEMLQEQDGEFNLNISTPKRGLFGNQRQISFQSIPYDIHNPDSLRKEEDAPSEEESFADKIMRLSKRVSLKQLAPLDTVEVNLTIEDESELEHLVWDFDEIDTDLTLKNYQKLTQKIEDENAEIEGERAKYNRNSLKYGSNAHKRPNNENQRMYETEKQKLHNHPQCSPVNGFRLIRNGTNHLKKSVEAMSRPHNQIRNERSSPRQMQQSAMQNSHHREELFEGGYPHPSHERQGGRKSAIYDVQLSSSMQANQMDHSSNLQSYENSQEGSKGSTFFGKYNHGRQYEQEQRDKIQSAYQKPVLQRHKSNKAMVERNAEDYRQNGRKEIEWKHYNDNIQNQRSPTQKHHRNENMQERYRHQGRLPQHRQMNGTSPREFYNQQYHDQGNNYQKYKPQSPYEQPPDRKRSEHFSPKFKVRDSPNIDEIQENRFQNPYPITNKQHGKSTMRNSFRKKPEGLSGNPDPVYEANMMVSSHQPHQNGWHEDVGKNEKKQRLREKAAQLLNRVKSQEYLNRMNSPSQSAHLNSRHYAYEELKRNF